MKLTPAEKLRLVERPTWELLTSDGMNEIEWSNSWVQVTTPLAPVSYLNGILRIELTEEEALKKIDAAITKYKKLNVGYRIKICPSSKPANLKQILTNKGLVLRDTLFAFYVDPDEIHFPVNKDVSIKLLTEETLEDWLKVQQAAWGVPAPGLDYLRQQKLMEFEDEDSTEQNFIAYLNGMAVGTSAIRFFDDYAYLMGSAVNPDKRGQGIYKTLVKHRLELLKSKNIPGVIHCLEKTSAPICMKLGLEKVCEIYSFEPGSDS